jgi:glycosyltransferase involved in cell wall biosynthesis
MINQSMRIVVCHNHYQQAGGEDRVFADESQLLASHGHSVVTFTRHNDTVKGMRPWTLAARTIWNREAARQLKQLVRDERADIVHFHNTLPLISPSAYYAARRGGAAVVQTLHNYRLVCPKATFFRDGAACESCLGRMVPWPAVQHACYRDSRLATTAIAAMLTIHRWAGTYRRAIDAYISLSQFSRDKLIAGGLPAQKMHLRPNFMLTDPGQGHGDGGYAFYVGRLSPEKGIETLLDAWLHHEPGIPLVICGNGPLAPLVEQAAAHSDRIAWYPNRSDDEVLRRLGEASLFILPSVNYEGFPKTIVEAYAKGTPVVASRLGAMAELVHKGVSGECFTAGDSAVLARTVRSMIHDSGRLAQMRCAARRLFETRYSASTSYARLLEIYEHALRVRHGQNARLDHSDCASIMRSDDHVEDHVEVHADKREEICTL